MNPRYMPRPHDPPHSEQDSLLTFRITGARFTDMPMERVAKYMAALSELCPGARFVKVTEHSIVFDSGAEGGA